MVRNTETICSSFVCERNSHESRAVLTLTAWYLVQYDYGSTSSSVQHDRSTCMPWTKHFKSDLWIKKWSESQHAYHSYQWSITLRLRFWKIISLKCFQVNEQQRTTAMSQFQQTHYCIQRSIMLPQLLLIQDSHFNFIIVRILLQYHYSKNQWQTIKQI